MKKMALVRRVAGMAAVMAAVLGGAAPAQAQVVRVNGVPYVPAAAQGAREYCPDLGVLVERADGGLRVRQIRRSAAAEQLELEEGDLLVRINGRRPDSVSELHEVLFTGADHEDHELVIERDGEYLRALVFHDHGQVMVHTSLH